MILVKRKATVTTDGLNNILLYGKLPRVRLKLKQQSILKIFIQNEVRSKTVTTSDYTLDCYHFSFSEPLFKILNSDSFIRFYQVDIIL